MDWFKKQEKEKKRGKWWKNWRKRTNLMNIHIKTSAETIEAYYFADNIINNLIRSYPKSINVRFDGCKMEDAKHLLASFALWYLYAYQMPCEEGMDFKFGKPSWKTLASCIETCVRIEYDYDFEEGKDFDRSRVVPCNIYENLHELADSPFLNDKEDRTAVHDLYVENYSDAIKALPTVHPYLFKSFMAYAMRNRKYNAELVRICVMALRKAEYAIFVPEEYV